MSETNNNEEKEQTPEERLNWLRERGVQVETSEDRKFNASRNVSGRRGEFEPVSYAYVPHDTSKEMKEMTLRVYDEYKLAGDLLPDHLKEVFGIIGKANIDLTLFHKQASQHLSTEGGPTTISDATMRKLAEEGQVETFNLVKPVPSNKHTSINIYLDEVGMLKRLPLNKRASDFAAKAGFNPPPIFYGDVFVGRVANKPRIKNIDFKLGEDTTSDATWLKNAMMENLEYQTAMNQITGKEEVQAQNAGEDGIAKDEQGYQWTQTDEEVEIVVNIGEKATTTKDVKVDFRPTYVQVKVKGDIMMRIDLFARVDPDGCTWTLDKSGVELKLVITCEKNESTSWPRIQF